MEVAIHKLATQYRLPAGARDEQRRLDGLRFKALDDAFRFAIHGAGIDDEAELCIRSLFVPVRLSLNKPDATVSADWSAALAEEISRVLRHGPTTNMVVYHSRRQALLDQALGVARRDLRRAWAWRQLGLWGASHSVSDTAAVNELVSALERTPPMIVPTLQAVTRFGGWQSLSARFTAEHWEGLGRAVLREVRGASLPEATESRPSARTVRAARQVLSRSLILGAVNAVALRALDASARRAVAVLATTDADPALLRRDSAGTLVNLIAQAISSRQVEVKTEFDEPDVDGTPGLRSAGPRAGEVANAAGQAVGQPSHAQRLGASSDESHAVLSRREKVQIPPRSENRSSQKAVDQARLKQFPGEFPDEKTELFPDEKTELVDLRRRAISRFAGLLYLIGVIGDLDLPEQIAADESFGARPFAWILHQLALRLAPVAARDPAALAFAGLSPEMESAWDEEASPGEAETRALSELADQIVTHLGLLLEADEVTGIPLLEFVTRRRGEIVADPGWIEVRFSLDDVATEIRRAGLDLNPGYVPWLGVVVMFVYE